MVLIHITRGADEFVYQTQCNVSVDIVTTAIANLHNLRGRVRRLVGGVRDLAKYGPMKPEAERGLTEEQINALGSEKKEVSGADPIGVRVGQAPAEQLQQTLNQCAAAAEESVSNAHAKLRKPLDEDRIKECIQNIKGAVMMAYPMGLPEWDVVRMNLEEREDLAGTEDSKHVLDPATSCLWFAGKCMDRDYPLSKYIGTNEKVTIKARIEPKGGSAPQREPAVDEETRRKMMSYWHKKEQEAHKLEEADEDSYLNSAWANPKGFKQSALGLGNIKFKPGR